MTNKDPQISFRVDQKLKDDLAAYLEKNDLQTKDFLINLIKKEIYKNQSFAIPQTQKTGSEISKLFLDQFKNELKESIADDFIDFKNEVLEVITNSFNETQLSQADNYNKVIRANTSLVNQLNQSLIDNLGGDNE